MMYDTDLKIKPVKTIEYNSIFFYIQCHTERKLAGLVSSIVGGFGCIFSKGTHLIVKKRWIRRLFPSSS